MAFTRLELEQIRNARTYDDTLLMGPGAESGIDHSNDFNYVISQLRNIMGTGKWFDNPVTNLADLADAIVAVSGMIFEVDTWDDVFVRGSGILNVNDFDAQVKLSFGKMWSIKDSAGNEVMKISDNEHSLRRVGRREFLEAVAAIPANTEIVIPNGATYTLEDPQFRNLMVFRNGVLMLPGTGNDYLEYSASGIKFNYTVKKFEGLAFRILG